MNSCIEHLAEGDGTLSSEYFALTLWQPYSFAHVAYEFPLNTKIVYWSGKHNSVKNGAKSKNKLICSRMNILLLMLGVVFWRHA